MAIGRNTRLLVIVATFILFPTILILFLSKAKWIHKTLPYYSASEQTDTANSNTPRVGTYLNFTDHNGKPFSFKDFGDSCIVLVNIFFATCPEVCPEMNSQLQSVAEKINANPKETRIRFVSITIDPEHDSIPVLNEYAKRYKADRYHRLFVRCDNKQDLYKWIKTDLLLANDQLDSNFIHSDQVVLLDKKRYVRGIFETRAEKLLDKLDKIKGIEAGIDNLIYEYRQQSLEKKK